MTIYVATPVLPVCFAIVLLIGIFIDCAPGQSLSDSPHVTQHLEDLSEGFRRSIQPVLPTVVTIEVLRGPRNMPDWTEEGAREQFDQPPALADPSKALESNATPHDGTGSGLIIDSRGFILTCNHVVDSADTVFVRLSDGRRFEAVEIFSDPVTDLAVIKISIDNSLPETPLGNSDDLEIGDWVVSIGNPYELGLSVSAGIISATDRHLPTSPRTHLLQTDAATNPGNSGGALVNLQGQVVGISEGGYGSHEGFQGIGFAIPINTAKEIAQQLIKDGKASHAQLGFDTEPMQPKLAEYLGLAHDSGLMVCAIAPHSAASRAGLKIGDVVTHIFELPIRNGCEVVTAIERASPDKPLTLALMRNGTKIILEFVPELLSDNNLGRSQQLEPLQKPKGFVDSKFGIAVDDISAEEIKRHGYDNCLRGVIVTYVPPDSVAAKEGVYAGMLVLRVGNETVNNITDYRRAMDDRSAEKEVLVLVATPQQQHFVLFNK